MEYLHGRGRRNLSRAGRGYYTDASPRRDPGGNPTRAYRRSYAYTPIDGYAGSYCCAHSYASPYCDSPAYSYTHSCGDSYSPAHADAHTTTYGNA